MDLTTFQRARDGAIEARDECEAGRRRCDDSRVRDAYRVAVRRWTAAADLFCRLIDAGEPADAQAVTAADEAVKAATVAALDAADMEAGFAPRPLTADLSRFRTGAALAALRRASRA